jgi:hypothetical protein
MNRLIKLTNYIDKNNNGTFDNGEGVSEFSYTLDNLGRKDYAIGWSKYSGVLFDLGLAVKNPKSPTFKNSFPLWANKNFQSIARIDYWDYDGGWAYRPHCHTWGEKAHHYLDERYI